YRWLSVDLRRERVRALDRGSRLDLGEPPREVREVGDLLTLAHRLDPWIARDVGDRVFAGDVGAIGEPLVEHCVEPSRLADVAIDRIRKFLRSVVAEVVVLSGERTEPPHLPVQPLQAF